MRAARVLEFVDEQGTDPLALRRARGRVVGQQIAAQPGEIVEVERAAAALRFPVPLRGVFGEGRQIAGERGAAHARVGVEYPCEGVARRDDEILLQPLGAQRPRRGSPHLSPRLRKLTRSVRFQRRPRCRRCFLPRSLQRAAQLRQGTIELAPRARVLVESRLWIGE